MIRFEKSCSGLNLWKHFHLAYINHNGYNLSYNPPLYKTIFYWQCLAGQETSDLHRNLFCFPKAHTTVTKQESKEYRSWYQHDFSAQSHHQTSADFYWMTCECGGYINDKPGVENYYVSFKEQIINFPCILFKSKY